MEIPPEVLRAALEEYIAFGPATRRPAGERLAARLPPEQRAAGAAALAVAGQAVAAAESLAKEYLDGRRSQASITRELEVRYPWLYDDSPAEARPWWRLWPPPPDRHDLARRLAHFGWWVSIM